MKLFLHRWLITTLAVLLAAQMVSGIHYQRFIDLCAASLLLGILNAILRPLLMLLSLPLVLVTLGLFMLVINAFLLYLVGWFLQPHFRVDGFWAAIWGTLIIGFASMILGALTGLKAAEAAARRPVAPPSSRNRDDDGGGPVIDV
jgi:putative membrane protein